MTPDQLRRGHNRWVVGMGAMTLAAGVVLLLMFGLVPEVAAVVAVVGAWLFMLVAIVGLCIDARRGDEADAARADVSRRRDEFDRGWAGTD